MPRGGGCALAWADTRWAGQAPQPREPWQRVNDLAATPPVPRVALALVGFCLSPNSACGANGQSEANAACEREEAGESRQSSVTRAAAAAVEEVADWITLPCLGTGHRQHRDCQAECRPGTLNLLEVLNLGFRRVLL
mmetsp:Transcript_8914/g.20969  ORF Transcript_8914/g.20969 Transcript_8914/m.20969 type:complete len:137 (-) Transcript_8914:100-510(-)